MNKELDGNINAVNVIKEIMFHSKDKSVLINLDTSPQWEIPMTSLQVENRTSIYNEGVKNVLKSSEII